jgi:hypothetical protein
VFLTLNWRFDVQIMIRSTIFGFFNEVGCAVGIGAFSNGFLIIYTKNFLGFSMIKGVFDFISAKRLIGFMFIILLPIIQWEYWNINLSLNVFHYIIYWFKIIVIRVCKLVVLRLIAETFQAGLIFLTWHLIIAKSLS